MRTLVTMGRRVGLAVAALGLLFMMTPPSRAEAAADGESTTPLSPDSDGGGTNMKLSCGPDRALIGIAGASGQWVDRVQGICMQVTSDGKWIGSETMTPTSGGSSGTPYSIRCATNSAVVALSGRAGQWVDKLQVHCKPLSFNGSVTGNMVLAGAAGGTGGSTGFGPNMCDDNRPARALAVFAGGNVIVANTVDRIGLTCSRPAVIGLKTVSLMAFETITPNSSRGEVALTRATPTAETVTLTSSDPLIASVPASVSVGSGQSTASFSIRPGSAGGCVRITAADRGVTRIEPFVVQPPYPDLAHFDLGSEKQLLFAGRTYKGSVKIDTERGMTVTMASNNPAVATVPASVTVQRGAFGMADYPITAVGRGCAMITATYGPWTIHHYVMVEYIPG
jgi:hypothetical protein